MKPDKPVLWFEFRGQTSKQC